MAAKDGKFAGQDGHSVSRPRQRSSLWQGTLLPLSLFVLAIVIRLIYLHQIKDNPFFEYPVMDPLYHHEWASRIAGGDFVGDEVFFRAPLYPYFLALLYRVFAYSQYAVRLVQLLIGGATCLLTYHIAKRVFGFSVAVIAGLWAAIYPMFFYFEGELLITFLIVFLDAVAVLLLLKASETPTAPRYLAAGAVLGLSAIARPNILLVAVVLPFWMWTCHGLRRAAVLTCALAVGVLLLVLPVTIRNYAVGRDFVPIASQGGLNFYLGNNPNSDGRSAVAPELRKDWWGGYEDAISIAEESEGRSLTPSEVSGYWYRRTREFFFGTPGAAALHLLKKTYFFFNGYEYGNNQDSYFFRRYSSLLRIPIPGYWAVMPLAICGVITSIRRFNRGAWLLLLLTVVYATSMILFFVCDRYRMPVVPYLIIFAALGLVNLVRMARSRDWPKLVVALLVLAAASVFVNTDIYSSQRPTLAQSYSAVGETYHKQGKFDLAIQEYRKAIEVNPAFDDIYKDLGASYMAKGMAGEAIDAYHKDLEYSPRDYQTHANLGWAYQTAGDFELAAEHYRRSLEIEPAQADARYNLGMMLYDEGSKDKAAQEFGAALEVDPSHRDARNALGVTLAQSGREEEAIAQWEELLRQYPEMQMVRRNIAIAREVLASRKDSTAAESPR